MRLRNIPYTFRLFRLVRNNEPDGFSSAYEIRLVCRYHCLIEYQGWNIRWAFQKPESRSRFIDTCTQCIREMEQINLNGLFDKPGHYYVCHRLLMILRLLTERMPLIWWLVFRLHL